MIITEKQFDAMLEFAKTLIRQPSPMLAEGKVADLIEQEMHKLGYDEVRRDELGNVVGFVRGSSDGPSIMLNGHMDHVQVSDADRWQHDPFGSHTDGRFLYGRGAADMKASLAVMVHCAVLFKQMAGDWSGEIVVAAVVLEEPGVALGTRHLLKEIRPEVAIVGEPTGNKLVIGHRGKAELLAVVQGKSCHASMPEKGVNPLFALAEFIKRIGQMNPAEDALLGKATLTPTVLGSDQSSTNVIPSQAKLYIDSRNVQGQEAETLLAKLNEMLGECLTPGTSGDVQVSEFAGTCYTGKGVRQRIWLPCFRMDPAHQVVRMAEKVLSKAFGEDVQGGVVGYASDAAVLSEQQVPTVIFGPGEPSMAHVRDERIELAQMRQAAGGFLALIKGLTEEA